MTKEQALYQVKLILDYMPDEEYEKISEKTIKYINENMEYSKDISVNPDVPLEEQKIDDKTYEILEDIIKEIEENSTKIGEDFEEFSNEELVDLVKKYERDMVSITKAKELLTGYKNALKIKDDEIKELKSINKELYSEINNCPGIIKKLYFKKIDGKLLK